MTYITQLSTSEEPALARMCTFASRLIDRYTGRRFWTSTADETLTLDGPRYESRSYDPGIDIAALTTLEIAQDEARASSGTYTSISTGDWYLRPVEGTAARPAGWPAREIWVVETQGGSYPNSTQPYLNFQPYQQTVRLTGRFGWNTTTTESTNFPQEVRLVAVELATRLWRTREQGFSNTIGVSEVGTAVIERVLSPLARDVLEQYRRSYLR